MLALLLHPPLINCGPPSQDHFLYVSIKLVPFPPPSTGARPVAATQVNTLHVSSLGFCYSANPYVDISEALMNKN